MGIYGAHWLDNDNFVTCSADNKVKTWKIDGGETPERTLLQTAEEVKRADPEKQVLGLYSGPDGAIGGVNLHNELLSWSTDNTL
jgi:WD40 repeat protein